MTKSIHFPIENISINGVQVTMVEVLDDGTQVYTIEDMLFDHKQRVEEAYDALVKKPSIFGPLGERKSKYTFIFFLVCC